MTRNRWIALGVLAAAVASVFLYDALVVSDEERLEALADDVAGPVSAARIAAGRARWIDLARQPFELGVDARLELYEEGDEAALDERARDAARVLAGSRLRLLTSDLEALGDRASITMRVLDERTGMHTLAWSLRKHGGDWLIERLAVRR